MSDEQGVFTGSGSFLVDRTRALDKLMRFQLPNPAAFALAWARCASAGEASHFTVTADAGVLTATFDGRPFTKAELEDPYRCLFEQRAPLTDRNRQLAVGLLSVLRLKPAWIRLISGSGAARVCLNVATLESESFEDAPTGEETVLIAAWPGLAYASAREAADLVRDCCVLSPMEIKVDGAVLPGWRESGERRQYFADDVSRGWVDVPSGAEEESELQLCWHGTVIEKITMKLPLVQVRAAINDDGFTLNASQSGIVRDARFDAALKKLAEPARLLILSSARALAAEPVGAVLLDRYFRRRWRETLEIGEEGRLARPFDAVVDAAQTLWTMASGDGPGSAKEAALTRRAETVRWLRRLCARRLRPRSKTSTDEVINALWSAPLYLDANASALSLDELAVQQKRLSYVPYCAEPAPGLVLPFRPLWSIGDGEADLPGRLLDSPMRDVTATVAELKNDPRRRDGSANFEVAGLPVPLIRAHMAVGEIEGEVGLSTVPGTNALLHLLTQGLPSGVVEIPGRLRFEAVVSDPDRKWDERPLTGNESQLCGALASAARSTVIGLYRSISEEHDPRSSSARAASIRAHLLDYLAYVLAGEGPNEEWIRKLSLFEDRDGRWIDHYQASGVLHAQPLYAARRAQEQAWQDDKSLILSPDFDAARLISLFPGCVLLPIRGRSGVFALVSGVTSCPATPDGGRCVAAFRIDDSVIHAVLPKTEDPADFSWENVTVHAVAEGGTPLTAQRDVIIELVLALVRQAGTLLEKPKDPLRLFLLRALWRAPAPWPGAAGKALWEQLRGRGMFRGSYGSGRSLEDLFAALNAPGGRVTYAAALSGASETQPDVLLDEEEFRTLARFQPLGAENLRPAGSPDRVRPSALPPEPQEPAPSGVLSVFRGKPVVRANERFFLERRYGGRGLEVWIGLSTRLPPPGAAFIPDSALTADLSLLPPVASILVDAATSSSLDGPAAVSTIMGFLCEFYEDVATRWPLTKPENPAFPVSQRYVLEVLRLSAAQPGQFTGWKPLLRKLRGLKLFTVLDGGWLSLDEIAEYAAQDKFLLFADPALPVPAITDGRPVPVMRHPKIAAEILFAGKVPLRIKRYKPTALPAPVPVALSIAPVESIEETKVDALPPESHDLARPPVLEAAFRLLRDLSGRKGLKLPRHELADLRLDRGFDGTLLIQEGSWTLNTDDALVKAILASNLSTEEQSAYLASVAYTASNRLKNQVTDLDDIRFQEALADAVS